MIILTKNLNKTYKTLNRRLLALLFSIENKKYSQNSLPYIRAEISALTQVLTILRHHYPKLEELDKKQSVN